MLEQPSNDNDRGSDRVIQDPQWGNITLKTNWQGFTSDGQPIFKGLHGHWVRSPADEFEVQTQLGQGTYATVLKVRHKTTGQFYAVKVLKLSQQTASGCKAISREIRIMMGFLGAPFLIQIYAMYQFTNEVWLVMESCDAGSLETVLERQGPLSPDRAAQVIKMVLQALLRVHTDHRIHRDIKPANILISKNGHVVLSDFGLSTVLEATVDTATTLCGTPYFVAPELCSGLPYGPKVDIWAVGILLYTLLTGSVPLSLRPMRPQELLQFIPNSSPADFELPGIPDSTYRWRANSYQDLAPFNLPKGSNWSPALKDFLQCCLIHNPDQRWSVKQLLQHEFMYNVHRFVLYRHIENPQDNPRTIVSALENGHMSAFLAENRIEIEDIGYCSPPNPQHRAWPCRSNYVAVEDNFPVFAKYDDFAVGAACDFGCWLQFHGLREVPATPLKEELQNSLSIQVAGDYVHHLSMLAMDEPPVQPFQHERAMHLAEIYLNHWNISILNDIN